MRKRVLASGGEALLTRLLRVLQPLSFVALLATLVLLFAFQGEQIVAQPLIIAMLALPILIQVYFDVGLAYLLNRATGEAHCIAGPSALIGASLLFGNATSAYEAVPVTNGATITGTVRYDGVAPPPARLEISKLTQRGRIYTYKAERVGILHQVQVLPDN